MKKLTAILLTTALFLTGCGSETNITTQNTAQPQNKQEETYTEKEITMPEHVQVFQTVIDKEGAPQILAFAVNEIDKKYAAYEQYSYQKDTWVQSQFVFNKVFAKEKMAVLQDATRVENNVVYVAQNKMLEDNKTNEYVIWKVSEEKADKLFTLSAKKYQNMQILPDGNLSVLSYDGSLTFYDSSNGKKISTYKDSVCLQKVVGDILYVVPMTYDKIQAVDIKSGEVIDEYSNNLTNYGLSMCADDDGNTYCVTENGIYELDEKEHKLKEIVGNDKFSVQAVDGSTSQQISDFGIKDGIFYVIYRISSDNKRQYKMYQYSK